MENTSEIPGCQTHTPYFIKRTCRRLSECVNIGRNTALNGSIGKWTNQLRLSRGSDIWIDLVCYKTVWYTEKVFQTPRQILINSKIQLQRPKDVHQTYRQWKERCSTSITLSNMQKYGYLSMQNLSDGSLPAGVIS